MVNVHENIVGIDSAIFMHPTIWKASGHVDAFNDPLIDNRDSKKRYRADVLIEDQIAKYDEKIEKEVEKARKRFKDSFNEEQYRETSPKVAELAEKRDALHKRFQDVMNAEGGIDLDGLKQIILHAANARISIHDQISDLIHTYTPFPICSYSVVLFQLYYNTIFARQ